MGVERIAKGESVMSLYIHYEVNKCYALYDPPIEAENEGGFSLTGDYQNISIDICISDKMLKNAVELSGTRYDKVNKVKGKNIDSVISTTLSRIRGFVENIRILESIDPDINDTQKNANKKLAKYFTELGAIVKKYVEPEKNIGENIYLMAIDNNGKKVDITSLPITY